MYFIYIIISIIQIILGLTIIFLVLFKNNKNIDIYNKYNNNSILNFFNFNEHYNFLFNLTTIIIIIFLLLTIILVYLNNKFYLK